MVIPGFDNAVSGMSVGEKKEFIIEPNDAYGPHNPDLKKSIPKSMIKMDKDPEVGMVLMMQTPQGQQVPLKIIQVTKDDVMIDMNHPLAGKKLIFNIEIVDVKDKSEMETYAKEHAHEHSCTCEEHECDDECDCEEDCTCIEEEPKKISKTKEKTKVKPKIEKKSKTKPSISKKKK